MLDSRDLSWDDGHTVAAPIQDLTPFFEDRCWMFVLLAGKANTGVILRRGPTDWWRVALWDTERDRFEQGQWFHGRLYPEKCDLSTDGKLFLYFAGKYRQSDVARGYSQTWTAVSRPPYLTALALWPIGDTWGGRGVFLGERTLLIATSAPSFVARHHPDHPPGPLRVVEYCQLKEGDPRREALPCWLSGWLAGAEHGTTTREFRKASGGLVLGREMPSGSFRPSRRRAVYTLYRSQGETIARFEAHWADWDQQGRLVATAGGRVLSASITGDTVLWHELAAMQDERPVPIETPNWAQHW